VFPLAKIDYHHLYLNEDQNKYSKYTQFTLSSTHTTSSELTKLIRMLLGGLPSVVVYKLIYNRTATLVKGIFEIIG